MAAKLVALYKQPADVAAFDKRYFNEHIQLVRKFPYLRRIEISRGLGKQSPYYLMCEMYFDSVDEMRQCLQSPEAGAAVQDAGEFAGDIMTIMQVDEVQSEDVRPGV
jgi:uncharacterized protein (TIGR02118 family)